MFPLLYLRICKSSRWKRHRVCLTLDAAWPGIMAAAASVCPRVPMVESGRGCLWAVSSQQDPWGSNFPATFLSDECFDLFNDFFGFTPGASRLCPGNVFPAVLIQGVRFPLNSTNVVNNDSRFVQTCPASNIKLLQAFSLLSPTFFTSFWSAITFSNCKSR